MRYSIISLTFSSGTMKIGNVLITILVLGIVGTLGFAGYTFLLGPPEEEVSLIDPLTTDERESILIEKHEYTSSDCGINFMIDNSWAIKENNQEIRISRGYYDLIISCSDEKTNLQGGANVTEAVEPSGGLYNRVMVKEIEFLGEDSGSFVPDSFAFIVMSGDSIEELVESFNYILPTFQVGTVELTALYTFPEVSLQEDHLEIIPEMDEIIGSLSAN